VLLVLVRQLLFQRLLLAAAVGQKVSGGRLRPPCGAGGAWRQQPRVCGEAAAKNAPYKSELPLEHIGNSFFFYLSSSHHRKLLLAKPLDTSQQIFGALLLFLLLMEVLDKEN